MDSPFQLSMVELLGVVAVTGAIGSAAFALVDALKLLPRGGISCIGFKFIRRAVLQLTPANAALDATCLSTTSLLTTLHAHWVNGVDGPAQIGLAKTLIMLRLTPSTAVALARMTALDADLLTQVATHAQDGTPLTPEQTEIHDRFEQVIGSLLDQAYQRADQRYRNAAKVLAMPMAIGVAVLLSRVLPLPVKTSQAILLGLIATPIAPVAKDLTSLIASGFK